jgi:hypothetical protein
VLDRWDSPARCQRRMATPRCPNHSPPVVVDAVDELADGAPFEPVVPGRRQVAFFNVVVHGRLRWVPTAVAVVAMLAICQRTVSSLDTHSASITHRLDAGCPPARSSQRVRRPAPPPLAHNRELH